MRTLRTDYIGQTFNELTIKSRAPSNKWGHSMYHCQCSCGKECIVEIEKMKRPKNPTRTCGHVRANRFKGKEATAYQCYREAYKGDGLTFQEFLRMSQEPCHYCHLPAEQGQTRKHKTGQEGGDFTYHGLDRIDNEKGHTPENVVPCCWPCNQMKKNKTYLDFMLHIKSIYNNHLDYYQLDIIL